MKKINLLFVLLFSFWIGQAQKSTDKILNSLDQQTAFYGNIAFQIWNYAEMGYQEEKSVELLSKTLENEDFQVKMGVAGMPTAFVAEYGSGSPIIAIMGEFDALPGLSQKAFPEKISDGKEAGHACGHHLFGTASTAAAISLKNWLKENNQKGTIRLYGTPAEEGGSGKVYLTRAGIFNDVDVVLHWHPNSANVANPGTALANKSAKFRFYGVSAHAAAAPEKGRSSLDGVESMNYMVNMMREHIPSDARIHYVITNGGKAPNVVPDFAEVYYYARHPQRDEVIKIFDRIVKAAEGAALGTGTRVEYEMIGGTHELLPNLTLQEVVYKNLQKVGGYTYTEEEKIFAEKIAQSLGTALEVKYVEGISPFNPNAKPGGSTDVGDVSYNVPTVGFGTATWVPGTAAHSWQAVAAGGTSIGVKGMMVAAKTLTITGIELFQNPELIKKAKAEFEERRGKDFQYAPLLGDREPALNYREN
ncbi:MAG: amidohydrolase [Flavobacteriales bacterium CG_4_9_14_3_um_filter_40_17]|nr:MAG: amidohydrolase [Flavobacteriales bacterium CG_4_9_14_3_um_filter_40_17]